MSYLGLDVGTSRVKAVAFDREWRETTSAAEATAVAHPGGGRSEQDMVDVWRAAARVLAATAQSSPDPVELVAITAQGDGCWLVDKAGEPVGPALLWNDNRAASIVREWSRDGTLERAFRRSGSLGMPGLANAQLRWLQEHQPAVLNQAEHLLSCGSWVFSRLTGRYVLEASDAANPFCDAQTGRLDDSLLDLFGLNHLRHLLPPVVTGEQAVAPLRDDCAQQCKLPAGVPVVIAPYDVVSTTVGSGATQVDDACTILGTTLCTSVVSDDPQTSRHPNGMTLPTVAGRWLLAYATMSGTGVLDWVAGLLGLADAAAVVRLAGQSRAAELPVVLPYLSPAGERSPFLAPEVRGSITGLSDRHTGADIALATLQGLTFTVRDCLDATERRPRLLSLCGGGARSSLWCQLLADATGTPVVRPDVVEVGARGAVVIGAARAHVGQMPSEAFSRTAPPGLRLEPTEAERERYQRLYAEFVRTRSALWPGTAA